MRYPAGRVCEVEELLTGLIVCGACGASLVSAGTGLSAPERYVCPSAEGHGCGLVSCPAAPLERLTTELALRRLEGGDMLQALSAAWGGDGGAVADTLDAYTDTEAQLNDLLAAAAGERAAYSPVELLDLRAALDAKRATIARHLTQLASSRSPAARLSSADLRVIWGGNDLEWRRRLLAVLIERIVVEPDQPGGPDHLDPAKVMIAWKA